MLLTDFIYDVQYAFNPRKPLLFVRLVMAVLGSWLGKTGRLRYVDFALDFGCNLKCVHCFATALEDDTRQVMGERDYARVAQECMRLGALNFSFQGGEPLLFNQLGEIIKACEPWRNVISVTTNGTLLTDGAVQRLRTWGVDIVTVSLDSSIAQEHDEFRGVEGTFNRTVAGIHRAHAAGLKVTLATVVTHQNLQSDGLQGLIQFARKHRFLLCLILPVPAGNWRHHESFSLSEDDLRFIDQLTATHHHVRTDFQANIGGYGCGAAKEILYLTPYGDVLVCPFLHISFGNVLKDSVRVIRERALRVPVLGRYHDKCLASTDAEFIRTHLSKTFDADKLPLPYELVFPDEQRPVSP
jgi:MoaA/NifB/PqqE/SkfB family radical SAM enzyme